MLNFAVYFVGESGRNTQFLEDNFMEIMGIFFTLYIGLVAFVYPKIIDTKEKIKNISKILTNRIDKIWYIKDYLILIISILSIDFILFYLFKCQFWFICINIIISVIILLISCFVFKKLEEFLFKPTSFLEPIDKFNFKNKRDSKKVKNNLESCKDLIIDTVTKNNYHNYDIYEGCLDYIINLFIRFIKIVKNKYNPKVHNKYFKLIFHNMNDLNQKIIRRNTEQEIYYIFMDRYYYMIQQYHKIFLTEIIKNEQFLQYINKNTYEPIDCFIDLINYAIKYKYYEDYICDFLKELYKLLIKYDMHFEQLKPNNAIFNCVKNILLYCDNKNVLLNNFFDNFYKVFPLKEEFIKDVYIYRYKIKENKKEFSEEDLKEILKENEKYLNESKITFSQDYNVNLTFSLLSLLYYHKNCYLFKQLFSIANGRPNCFIKGNISDLFEIIIKCEILNNNQDIDINISDTKYKYYIITFIMILIKQHFDDIISYSKKECVNVKIDKKERLINFTDEFKKNGKIKEYFLSNRNILDLNAGFAANETNISNFTTSIKNSFEEILTNTEFCEVMGIDINKKEEYRKFIDEKLNELEEIVKSNE